MITYVVIIGSATGRATRRGVVKGDCPGIGSSSKGKKASEDSGLHLERDIVDEWDQIALLFCGLCKGLR